MHSAFFSFIAGVDSGRMIFGVMHYVPDLTVDLVLITG